MVEAAGTGLVEASVVEAEFQDEPLDLLEQPVGLQATGLASTSEDLVFERAMRLWKDQEQRLASKYFRVVEVSEGAELEVEIVETALD